MGGWMIMLKFWSSGFKLCLFIGKNGSILLNGLLVSNINR